MPYIIDQANMIKNGQLQRCSIVVDGNRIDYISQQTKAYRWIRMPVNEFLLTPGYIMLDFSFQTPRSFPEFKEYMQQHFLSKGCTSLLAVCDVLYEQQLPNALQKLRQSLLNSPIDYFIGAKIPFRLLTPSFIRACKRWKVPVLFVELQGEERLEEAPWSWMYEAFVSYPVTLVPYWITQDATKRLQMRWKELLSSYRIPFIPFALQERTPLSLDVLKKIGVYPHKGDVRIGGEVDYNLYARTLLSDSVAETAIVDYDKHIPMITVHNGRIMRAGNHLFFYPGFGKERTIRVPGMFAADF
ncbi:hypothetical protein AT864_00112 [Anoxybacillus sp. P3H1B]|uniref:Uncharacterized protein n=1 Tax=Anoxybacteroides rupiense TaxID=311460 RepID=A0ABD5IUJ0_9BACL|nr:MULTISPECIES: hypothetical protein [Anoxybacillus]KXG11029.1 hypothetical protein AT864_00112 [Anoxybacillus sp. P3H1B]MBB3906606.1 hypothetical protein [Anoxybacillus rupiensis]MBS2770271.1 hypothetical protein [Anoxybacillus rupiensis]MED5051980.1 hypothetical protein [Anoxybacillus rupiensis]